MEEHVVDRATIYNFILAGNCECSIVNENSGRHFAYKIKKAKTDKRTGDRAFYVKVSYSYETYKYAGLLVVHKDGSMDYHKGANGTADKDAPSITALRYTLDKSRLGTLPKGVNVYHFGRCGRCGRVLEDPESIRLGLGPICRGRS